MPLTNAAKIGIGWATLVVVGLTSFVLSKSIIDQKRYDSMKIRERMKNSNTGEYQYPARFES